MSMKLNFCRSVSTEFLLSFLKIDHVTIGVRRPQSQHTFTLKNIFYNLDKYILQFGQITFEKWILKLIVCVTIGAWRPQHTFALNSFIFKQFRNARWISIQARLDHYTTISNKFHQNMHREYFSMCNACWVDPKMLNRDEQYSIQIRYQCANSNFAHCTLFVNSF